MLAFTHGDETHDDGPRTESQLTATQADAISGDDTSTAGTPVSETVATRADASADKNVSWSLADLVNDLSLSDFPTLHPLVVHIPVTLIPIAFLFSVLNLLSIHRIFIWLTLGFAVAGLLGGVVAAFPLHPHTTGLSEAAKVTLQKHDFFAYGSLWLTSVAALVAILCAWKPSRFANVVLCAVLLLSAMAVAITGHYGGTLAYVHGIGIQGEFLSTH